MKINTLILCLLFSLGSLAADLNVPNNGSWSSSLDYEIFNTISLGNGSTFTVNAGDTVECDSVVVLQTATMYINGVLKVNGGLNILNNATIYLTGQLSVGGDVDVSNNGGVDIEATGDMDVAGDFNAGNNSDITNDGSLTIEGDFNNEGDVVNSGTITVGGTVNGGGTITNTGEGTLPVEFGDANASIQNGQITLVWNTLSELNNDYFSIEYSLDMNTWYSAGIVSGNGTTSMESNYTLSFNPGIDGLIYVKLMQVDYDGTTEMLKILNIEYNSVSHVIYPQPLKSGQRWNITGLKNTDIVEVYNAGMQLMSQTKSLDRGLYFVVINNKEILKLIVE